MPKGASFSLPVVVPCVSNTCGCISRDFDMYLVQCVWGEAVCFSASGLLAASCSDCHDTRACRIVGKMIFPSFKI